MIADVWVIETDGWTELHFFVNGEYDLCIEGHSFQPADILMRLRGRTLGNVYYHFFDIEEDYEDWKSYIEDGNWVDPC